MEVQEFEIPVPWGHIAVKAWGHPEDTPVLAVHGLGDNAGTFDRLMPYLPTSFYYICIDLPSHGKSSHYPPHLLISSLDNILSIKLVVDHLARKKYIYMGHSWGGQAGIFFTQLYPEYIIKLIVFDTFHFIPVASSTFKDFVTLRLENLTRINEKVAKNKPPLYTYDEAVTKLMKGRVFGELLKESAEALLIRSLVPAGDGKFKFSTDPRLKAVVNPIFDLKYMERLVKKYPITCSTLFVYATDSQFMYVYYKGVVREFRRQNKHCLFKKVTGSHDVHNNSPELVGPIVNTFLSKSKSKL